MSIQSFILFRQLNKNLDAKLFAFFLRNKKSLRYSMSKSIFRKILLALGILFIVNCLAHESDVIYDDSQVLEFHITFVEEAWYDTLWQNYLDGFETDEQEYTSATFTFNLT